MQKSQHFGEKSQKQFHFERDEIARRQRFGQKELPKEHRISQKAIPNSSTFRKEDFLKSKHLEERTCKKGENSRKELPKTPNFSENTLQITIKVY